MLAFPYIDGVSSMALIVMVTDRKATVISEASRAGNRNGKSAAALTNGTLQLWEAKGNMGRSAALGVVPVAKAQQALFGKQTWKYVTNAKHVVKGAFEADTEITDLKILRDGHTMLSRGADEKCRLWDIRKLKEAVHAWHMPLSHSHSRLAVSPQEDLVLAGAPRCVETDACNMADTFVAAAGDRNDSTTTNHVCRCPLQRPFTGK